MANPSVFISTYGILPGRAGEQLVTQEPHPGSPETSQNGSFGAGKAFSYGNL